jgi:glutaredoxin-like YruB-family protein
MKTKPVHSYADLEAAITKPGRSYLLIYKSGSEQSECALGRIETLESREAQTILIADVNHVSDIHNRLGVTSAPSLVIFKEGRVVNVVKGCQTGPAYTSIFAGREIGRVQEEGVKKTRQVTVYTTPTCSWCTTLKTYLDQQQVSYREINVAADTSAADAMVRKSGQQGVPQTEINGQMIVGFDKARINQLLEIK